ncbi:MAG: hypothetical protein HC816_00160 [Leptolyngbyaceae cyanobacterium RM1_1_2]|nr:hypothetical protein [Leptolyngbyaceae cyanobacterium RM1_1_2]
MAQRTAGADTSAIAELEHLKQRYLYLFLKLMQGDRPAYALSHNFTLLSDANNNLQRVAQVLRHLVAQF